MWQRRNIPEPRSVEGKRYVHLPRFCCIFAPDGTFKMPTATLLPENRGRWRPFDTSNCREKIPLSTAMHLTTAIHLPLQYTG